MHHNRLTVRRAAEGIRKRTFSVTELVSDCLAEIEARNADLNAYLEVFDTARERAKKADDILSRQKHGTLSSDDLPPLFGIPIAVKDNILVAGRRATAGSRILENYVAAYDATVVAKLKTQGAIILGKTNLDEFAMGSSTENSAFGPTRNPYDRARVPGGSSGGSAAAVAANLCSAALGSDTGGSIRQPASFCGIVGFKPTYGAVSRHGLIAMASSLDQIGPLAKNVEDAEILFGAIRGGDAFDSTAVKTTPHSELPAPNSKNLRIGLPKEYFGAGLDPEVERVVKSVLERWERAGARTEDISLPHASYALSAYYIIAPSEISTNLARFDGVRYGALAPSASGALSLFDAYAEARAAGFGPEVKRRIMLGTYALSAGYYEAYYQKAQKVRRLIRKDFEDAFSRVDVIAGPATPTSAFPIGEKTEDPLQMYLADVYTVAANLAGVPALSLPAGRAGNLPIGIQLIGPRHQDERLLAAAKQCEELVSL